MWGRGGHGSIVPPLLCTYIFFPFINAINRIMGYSNFVSFSFLTYIYPPILVMATQLIQFIRPITLSYRNYNLGFENSNNKKANRPFYAGGWSGGSNWDGKQNVKPNQRSKFRNQYMWQMNMMVKRRSLGLGRRKAEDLVVWRMLWRKMKKRMKDFGFLKVPLVLIGFSGYIYKNYSFNLCA